MWTIEDLGSKNGTQVNQYLITGTQELSHNDVISLGHIKLIVKVKTTGTNGTSNRYSRKINNYPRKTIVDYFLSKAIFVLASVMNVCNTGKLPQTIF